jgi:HD-GYP domain-containing protein (c-di-GMP phosphodiesterase class II)
MVTDVDHSRGGARGASERSAGVQRLLAQFRPGLAAAMPVRERRAEAAVALAFLAVAVPMAVLGPRTGSHSALVAALFVAIYAITSRVEFDVGAGYSSPIQLALIPMLYALPPGWVPLLVAGGFVVGKLPSFWTGSRHPDRAIVAVADGWHAVAPAAVFWIAGVQAPRWGESGVVIAMLAAQIVGDVVVSGAREWLRLGEIPRLPIRLLGAVYFADLCLSPIGLAVAFMAHDHPLAATLSLPLSGLLMFFARDRRARMETAVELSAAYRGTALLLGDVVEADDAYTGSHSRDVVDLSMSVGPMLGLDAEQLRRLEFAALLHDIGKIAIPKAIINKPGALDAEERQIIETHTVEGETMLKSVGGLLGEVGTIVRSCHERYDGLGYPDRTAGEAIPIEARIVASCDAFNAMTTDRSYRRAMPLPAALGELEANRGSQFDPRVVDALLALYADALVSADASPAPATAPAVEAARDVEAVEAVEDIEAAQAAQAADAVQDAEPRSLTPAGA